MSKIRFCSTGYGDWIGKVCGFQLHFGPESPINVGCYMPRWGMMPDFVLVDWERVLVVEACFGVIYGLDVVHTIKLVTNLRTFGPVGTDAGCTIYRNVGYDLTGFYGWIGHGLDSLGTYFRRC